MRVILGSLPDDTITCVDTPDTTVEHQTAAANTDAAAASDDPPGDGGVNLSAGLTDDHWMTPPPASLVDGTEVQLYKDGEALAAAYAAIEQAQSEILLEVYIFASDETGQKFVDLLAKKAAEGVRVYLLYDSFGSLETPDKFFLPIRRAGGRVRIFSPVIPWKSQYSWRPFNRDHRKLLVIDGKYAWLGGLNIAAEYAGVWIDPNQPRPPSGWWRDTAIGILGPSVHIFRQAFNAAWTYTIRGGRIRRTEYTASNRHGDLGVLASAPTMNSPLRPRLHQLFDSAAHSIDLTMAYFVPDDPLVEALCRAARRNVKVRLMLPGKSDVAFVITAARSFYANLMDAGVRIYERQQVVLHAKTMVVDQRLSLVGSTNLDYRSIEYNLELSALIRSQAFGLQMVGLFDNDVLFAKEIDPETWRNRHWVDRFVQWSVSRMRYAM